MPVSLVVDERELEEFVFWLPGLRSDEAYRVLLMIRSRSLKERYGFKGSDRVLVHRAVHGYLDSRIPAGHRFGGEKYWRLRLYNEIRRLGVLAVQAEWEYARFRAGTREIEELVTVPWQLLAIYVAVNPGRVLDAARDAVNEVVAGFVEVAKSGRIRDAFKRPDQRYYAGLARHKRTVFHSVDADTEDLAGWLEEEFVESLGFLPARIKTSRGMHFLVNLEALSGEQRARWVGGRIPAAVSKALAKYKSGGCVPEKCPGEYEAILGYVHDRRQPLYHRIRVLGEVARSRDTGAPLVEVSNQALEPAPGTLYKGVVVRFYPEEK